MMLSIITTVYDRVDCLKQCIASVKELNVTDYEHIIVSDCPPEAVVKEISDLVVSQNDYRIKYFNLQERHDNWGIAPLSRGLKEATGKYVAILSDDNGYLPNHFDVLIPAMEEDNSLSFVYSACWYRDMGLFAHPVPDDCHIDLGQPLYRRSLFNSIFQDEIPFNIYGFDWRVIRCFMDAGKWKFFPDPTFVFRLACYPQYMPKGIK
jgi:glycosyltransferase involved in cell wall biosynthesis